ncbi:hypothetical protein HXY33_05750 [Candidatus Bathyarchaeota archaeon]|nr:hypothetical protein [Candidatus Bathyarchaeota archaeon]
MSELISPLIYQLGVGGIGGLIVGFTIKKISKLILFLIGLFLIFLLYLGTSGVISINYDELWEALAGLFNFAGQAASWLIGIISLLPFVGSFFVGFLFGFKLG